MQVQVKHGSSNITGHTISYSREHKICTGIGMLELEVDCSYGGTFDPWDVITILEGGSRTGKYYVSSVSEGQPGATIVVTAQDNSKRLSDYFITDSYLVNYPSYTRYWIELFLTEVGISYSFEVDGPGNLLSNNTALGLMSAYEQIQTLLQMSGWYITFDPDGKALIGKANVDYGRSGGSFGNDDIIEIKVDKNDKMYRNRVVVWGAGDPSTQRWVFADVARPTKWDYDSKDKRTIVISNSNIPGVKQAFLLANKALLEFARLTIEKHVTIEGARNVWIGDVVRLSTKIFKGKGLVTTFGTSMSKAGLVTNLSLDERCPRLFGFFNLGGFVYVSTFGSGVWRKHIQPSSWSGNMSTMSGFASGIYNFSGWFDYSSGLMDMAVTDLHVNAGILNCVTSSGGLYYSMEEDFPASGVISGVVWSGVLLSGLQVTYSGLPVEEKVYSGLMGRACIIDRDTNNLRYAVDNRSGINEGDFLFETNPIGSASFPQFSYLTPSGISAMRSGIQWSGYRSWIIDASPYSGEINDIYSIGVSGNFDYSVYDIENDGTHDYVEAMTVLSGIIPVALNTGYRHFDRNVNISAEEVTGGRGAPFSDTLRTTMAYSGLLSPELQISSHIHANNSTVWDLYDYTPAGQAHIVFGIDSSSLGVTIIDVSYSGGVVSSTTYSTAFPTGTWNLLSCRKVSTTLYRYYLINGLNVASHTKRKLRIIDYDIVSNSVISDTTIDDVFDIISNVSVTSYPYSFYGKNFIIMGTKMYAVRCTDDGGYGFNIYGITVDLDTGAATEARLLHSPGELSFPSQNGSTNYYFPSAMISPYGKGSFRVMCRFMRETANQPADTRSYMIMRFVCTGFTPGSKEEVFDWTGAYGTTPSQVNYPRLVALNNSSHLYTYSYSDVGGGNTIYIDDVFDFFTASELDTWKTNNFGFYNLEDDPNTIIQNYTTSGFSMVDTKNFSTTRPIANPPGYTLLDYKGRDSYNKELFFSATNITTSGAEEISINDSSQVTRRHEYIAGKIVGNFRIEGGITDRDVTWVQPGNIFGYFPVYEVLQRSGWDFNVVKSGFYRDRIDISNQSPLVTMDRRICSTETFLISMDNSIQQTSHLTMSGYNLGGTTTSGGMFDLGILADDYKYAYFDDTMESGTSGRILVVFSGSVGSIDLYTLDSFSGIYIGSGLGLNGIPTISGVESSGNMFSGSATRIETSNYALPDQYTFVSVSGYSSSGSQSYNDGWGFWQKDPVSGVWVDYSSGYPQARTTMIRLDDSL